MNTLKTIIIGLYLAMGASTIGHITHEPEPEKPAVIEIEVVRENPVEEKIEELKKIVKTVEPVAVASVDVVEEPIVEPEVVEVVEEESILSDEEIDLIALITMAEAEGESEEGKRLVIDTILNRVDHERFPDTVEGVIYQKAQFSCVWNGRVDRCYVSEEICELVREELENRTNSDVIFFTAGQYGKYGTPLFVEGNHYFSSYA